MVGEKRRLLSGTSREAQNPSADSMRQSGATDALAPEWSARYTSAMADDGFESPAERRRARLRFRAQRRGFKEVDLIFGAFAEVHLKDLSETEVDQFEALLELPDQAVFGWLKGTEPVPPEFDTSVFARLRALCGRRRPKWTV
jgi:antitoxin CptB